MAIVFKDLPEGLWMIRWVDLVHVSNLRAKIGVSLVRLPAETTVSTLRDLQPRTIANLLAYAAMERRGHNKGRAQRKAGASGKEGVEEETSKFLLTDFGQMPLLAIGTVFEGREKGGVCVGSVNLMVREFVIEGRPIDQLHCPASAVSPFPPPSWWFSQVKPDAEKPLTPKQRKVEDDKQYRVLNKRAYALGADLKDSKCIIAQTSSGILVLPCSEVFRSYFAPTTRMANQLVRGSWDKTWQELAVPGAGTGILADGTGWQITLRHDVKEEEEGAAFLLANLIIDPDGLRAAHSVHHNLHYTGEAKKNREAGRPVHLFANLPFGWPRLKIKVACLKPYPQIQKYVGLRILQTVWEGPRKINIVREQDPAGGRNPDGDGEERNVVHLQLPQVLGDDVQVESAVPPGYGESITATLDGMIWVDPPDMPRRGGPEKVVDGGIGVRVIADLIEATSASAGIKHNYVTGVVPIDIVVQNGVPEAAVVELPDSTKFGRVARLLEKLSKAGLISSCLPFPPTSGALKVKVGERECWRLKQEYVRRGRNWVFEARAALPFLRTAMVYKFDVAIDALATESVEGAETTMQPGALAMRQGYWIELDSHPDPAPGMKEDFCSLIFTLDDQKYAESVIEKLLNYAVDNRGIWHPRPRRNSKPSNSGTTALGARSPQTVRHATINRGQREATPGTRGAVAAIRKMFPSLVVRKPSHRPDPDRGTTP